MRIGLLAGMITATIAYGTEAAEGQSADDSHGFDKQAYAQTEEDGLSGVLKLAKRQLARLKAIDNYSCTLVRRQRVGGELQEYEYIYLKLRHTPFGYNAYYLRPSNKFKGREVVYVDGENDNLAAVVRTFSGVARGHFHWRREVLQNIPPDSSLGIKAVTETLVELLGRRAGVGETKVVLHENAEIQGRPCTCIEVVHATRQNHERVHKIHIFIDDELNVLTRFVLYGWPSESGGRPQLLEEHTSLHLELDKGFDGFEFVIPKPVDRTNQE